LKKTIREYGSN